MQATPRLALLLAVVLALVPVTSGAEEAEPATGEPRNIFSDTEEVHLVEVDVTVHDGGGRPVRDLGPEDFHLLEGGRPVEIANFHAVVDGTVRTSPAAQLVEAAGGEGATEAAEPPPATRVHLAVLVDEAHLKPAHRSRVLAHLRRALAAHDAPGTRVLVASNQRQLVLHRTFTETRGTLDAALEDLAGGRAGGGRWERELADLIAAIEQVNIEAAEPGFAVKGRASAGDDEGPGGQPIESPESLTRRVAMEARALVPQILAYAQGRSDDVRSTLGVIEQMVDLLAGLPGRRVLLYVGEGLTSNPAEGLLEAFGKRFESLSGMGGIVPSGSEAKRFDAGRDIEALVERANARGVTLYTVDASPPAANRQGSAATVAGSGGNFGRVGGSVLRIEESNAQETLIRLAEGTGGRAALTPAMLDESLAGFFRDWRDFYSLGYLAEPLPPDQALTLEVEVESPEGERYTVRHRRSRVARRADERMAERTLTALLLDTWRNPLGVSAEVGEAVAAEGGGYAVPVMVHLPLGELVLLPGRREHRARVRLYVAVLDEAGRTSKVARQICPVRIPNQELLVALGRTATCGVRLRMRPGRQRLAVGVRDELAERFSTVEVAVALGEESAGGPSPGAP